MFGIKRVIAVFSLGCLVLNIALSDPALAQGPACPANQDKIAAPSIFDDLAGRIELQDMARIEMALEAQLIKTARAAGAIDINKLIKDANDYRDSMFKPAVNFSSPLHIFTGEVREVGNGYWRVMCRLNDRRNGMRTYYAVFQCHRDSDGGFPMETYTEKEWLVNGIERCVKNAGAPPQRKSERPRDAAAETRYKNNNERVVSEFIRRQIAAGNFAEIEGRAEELGHDAFPRRVAPPAYWPKELLAGLREYTADFLAIFGSSFDEVIAGKNIVFIKVPKGEGFPVIEEGGRRIKVRSRTSNSAMYFFMQEGLFDKLAKTMEGADAGQASAHDVINAIGRDFVHEIGASCGLPFVVAGAIDNSLNDLDRAFDSYSSLLRSPDYGQSRTEAIGSALLSSFSRLKGLKPVNLDILRGTNAMGGYYERDYAAGNGKSGKRPEVITGLSLTIKSGKSIIIGDIVEIKVVKRRSDGVKLLVIAPRHVMAELYENRDRLAGPVLPEYRDSAGIITKLFERCYEESIQIKIGDSYVTISVVLNARGNPRLVIDAPRKISIARKELLARGGRNRDPLSKPAARDTAAKTANPRDKTVMIVGGAGYIGSAVVNGFDELVRRYLSDGYKVRVFDNLSAGHRSALPEGVELVEGELADKDSLKKALVDSKTDTVIHFAAFIEVGESVKKPARYFRNNIINTHILLKAMREAGVKKIVFSSSAATYGTPERVPILETDRLEPINPYGESKYMMESLLGEYADKYGFKAVAFRYFNAAGAFSCDCGEDHDPETHIIPIFVKNALGDKPLTINGDGSHLRSYVNVRDLADAHIRAVRWLNGQDDDRPDEGVFEAFNLGAHRTYSNREIADLVIKKIRETTGRPCKSKIVFGPARAGDPDKLDANIDKARNVLGWEPRHSDIDTIIGDAVSWHLNHPDGFGETPDRKTDREALPLIREMINYLAADSALSAGFKTEFLERLKKDEIEKMRVLDPAKKEWADEEILGWARDGDPPQHAIYELLADAIQRAGHASRPLSSHMTKPGLGINRHTETCAQGDWILVGKAVITVAQIHRERRYVMLDYNVPPGYSVIDEIRWNDRAEKERILANTLRRDRPRTSRFTRDQGKAFMVTTPAGAVAYLRVVSVLKDRVIISMEAPNTVKLSHVAAHPSSKQPAQDTAIRKERGDDTDSGASPPETETPDVVDAGPNAPGKETQEVALMTGLAREAGRMLAPPAQNYTLFTSYNLSDNTEFLADKNEYSSRFGLERIMTERPYDIVDWVLKAVRDKGIDPSSVIVQLPGEFADDAFKDDIGRLTSACIKYLIVDTCGIGDEVPAKRAEYRRDIYSEMLFARAIGADTDESSPIYRLFRFFVESHMEDFDGKAAPVDAYMEAIKKNEFINAMLSYKPISRYDAVRDYIAISAALVAA
jgi:UDP-glucose 4-epimerase